MKPNTLNAEARHNGTQWEGWYTLPWRVEAFPVSEKGGNPKGFPNAHKAYRAASKAAMASINGKITGTDTKALINAAFGSSVIRKQGKVIPVEVKGARNGKCS